VILSTFNVKDELATVFVTLNTAFTSPFLSVKSVKASEVTEELVLNPSTVTVLIVSVVPVVLALLLITT